MNKIFVSYSRKDSPWVKRLYEHLRPLAATGDFEIWSDADITPGENWSAAIQRSIESVSAVILMVSFHYLASDFIANVELPQLVDVARARSLPIIPIIVSPVALSPQLEELQTVNPSGKALNQLSHSAQEAVMARAAEQIRKLSGPPARGQKSEASDLHSRALNIAISSTGVSGTINVAGSGNIFVDAERKLQEEKGYENK